MTVEIVAVATSSDDAHIDHNDTDYSHVSGFLKIWSDTTDGDRGVAGVRFLNVDIDKDSVVTSASIDFVSVKDDTTYDARIFTTIYGEAADNAATFSSGDNPLDRTRTTGSVTWNETVEPTAGDVVTTSDLSAIVEEIVGRPSWAANNAMVFIIEGGDTVNDAHGEVASLDHATYDPPELTVEWFTSYTEQSAFRIRDDDSVGLNSGTWAAAANTDASIQPDKEFRIRFGVSNAGNTITSKALRLQSRYRVAGGSWANDWAIVPNNTAPWAADGTNDDIQCVPTLGGWSNNDPTTELLGLSGAFVAGTGNTDSITNGITLTDGQDTEVEFALMIRKLSQDGHIADGDEFQFRLVWDSPVATFESYANTPTVTVANRPGHIGGTFVETPGNVMVADDLGNLYAVVEYTDALGGTYANTAVMMKSTDGGDSWNPVDEAGAPTGADLEAMDMHYVAADDEIHIAVQGPSSDDVFYWRFRTAGHASADTWGAEQTVDTAADPSSAQGVSLRKRADGTVVLFYKDSAGGFERCRYRIRSTGGTWGSENDVDTTASVDVHLAFCELDSNDDLHLVYGIHPGGVSDGEIWHRTIAASNDALSSRTAIMSGKSWDGSATGHDQPHAPPVIYNDGTERIGVIAVDEPNNMWFSSSPISSISFGSGQAVSEADVSMGNGGSHSLPGSLVYDSVSDEHRAFWAEDASPFRMRTDTRSSGTWGTNATQVTPVNGGTPTINWVRAIQFQHSGANGGKRVIGIMYDDHPGAGGTGGTAYAEIELVSIEALSGSVSAAAGITGNLTAKVPLAGSLSVASGIVGDLSASVGMIGSISASAGVRGFLESLVPLSGSISAAAGTTGTLSALVPLSGSLAAASGITGNLTALVPLVGSIDAAAGTVGALAVARPLVGSIDAAAGTTGFLGVVRPLSGSIDSAAGIIGVVSVPGIVDMSGSIDAAAAIRGAMTVRFVPVTVAVCQELSVGQPIIITSEVAVC